jgi:hypothetical protein
VDGKTRGLKPEEAVPLLHLVEKEEPTELQPEDGDYDGGGGDWFDPGEPDCDGLVNYIAVRKIRAACRRMPALWRAMCKTAALGDICCIGAAADGTT